MRIFKTNQDLNNRLYVNDIYTNHYIDWFNEFMTREEISQYKEHISEQLKKIEENIKNKQVLELNTVGSKECEYYLSEKCKYSSTKMSAAGFAPTINNSHKKILKVLAIPTIILLALALSVGAYFWLNLTNLINENFAPFFSAVISAVTVLAVFFFSSKKDQCSDILSRRFSLRRTSIFAIPKSCWGTVPSPQLKFTLMFLWQSKKRYFQLSTQETR